MTSINLLINGGIIDKAKYGIDKYSEEEELEQIKLAVASARLKGNGFLTTENLNTELQDTFNNDETVIEMSDYWFYNILDKKYTIYRDGRIKETLLPKEYQQVEYIESTGTQYIDTKVIQNSNCSVFYDANITYSPGINSGIFGCYNYGTEGFGLCQFFWSQKYYIAKIENNGTAGGYKSYQLDNTWGARHKFLLTKNILYIDGKFISDSLNIFVQNTSTCYLFSMNGASEPGKSIQKLFCAQLFDDKDKNIRNFIPCYTTTTVTDVDGIERPKDTIGLYDTVEGKFYVNKGSGTFIKGNDV